MMMFGFWIRLVSTCPYLLGSDESFGSSDRGKNDSLNETIGKVGIAIPVIA